MAFDTAWRLLGNACDAEDVVQDALLDAFQLHTQRAVGNWGGLLRRLTVCRAIDRLRTRKCAAALSVEPAAAESDRPEAVAIERELAEQLRCAIAKLPDREAAVFSLRYLGEMTNTEIAHTLEISNGAVGVAILKARAKLKEVLSLESATCRKAHQ